jgi:hypothetical protein
MSLDLKFGFIKGFNLKITCNELEPPVQFVLHMHAYSFTNVRFIDSHVMSAV